VLTDLLRPAYYFSKDFFDAPGRKRLKKNAALADQYPGKRVFLLLTGASLQEINIPKLNNEYTCSCNFIILHEDIKKINLSFFVSIDPIRSFTSGSSAWPESYQGLPGPERTQAYYHDVGDRLGAGTKLILHDDNYDFINSRGLLNNREVYFVKAKKDLYLDNRVPYGTMADLTKRSISGGGTIFLSVLILMYMGFKEIYLAGAGYTYDPVYMLHFYDNFSFPKSMGREQAETAARKAIDERNRKIGDRMEYYGLAAKGDKYNGIYIWRRESDQNKEQHRLLNDYAQAQGVKIYNIVPEGFASPIYEKITWQEVESRILTGTPLRDHNAG
jgi:hypothetical protein